MNNLSKINNFEGTIEFELKKLSSEGVSILLYDLTNHDLTIHLKDDARIIDIDWALKNHCPEVIKNYTVRYIIEKK
jgi:hypothetical protein